MTVVLSRELAKRFTDYLEWENIKYDVESYKKMSSIFVHIKSEEKNRIYDVLSEFVINYHIKRYVNSYLDTEFYFFEKNEKKNVVNDVLSRIKKNEISRKIESFFDENDQIILDGFFKFRMRNYMEYVDALIFEVADEMTAEKEINEFVQLLKYFVSIGDCTCDRVHVRKKDNEYFLTDDNGLSPLDMPSVMYEFSDLEHLPEDDLLSSLVSIAPKKIIFHNIDGYENDENLQLIYKVFENSIEYCDGKCNKCREIYDIEKPHNM